MDLNLIKLRGNLSGESIAILGKVFDESTHYGPLNAEDFRAEHDTWISILDQLQAENYLCRDGNNYRVTFFVLQLLPDNTDAKRLLGNCQKIYESLRTHYKDKQSRQSPKLLSVLATELGISFHETVATIEYLADVSHLWRGGQSIKYDDPAVAYVIPSESIVRPQSFDEILEIAAKQFTAPGHFPTPPGLQLTGDLSLLLPSSAMSAEGKLAPDAVILGFLIRENADDVVSCSMVAGLDVDWIATEAESYSNKTRCRAYFPRIQQALRNLVPDSKIAASAILASELLRVNPGLEPQLSAALNDIGWTIKDGKLHEVEASAAQKFFKRGAVHDAYVELRRIFQSAKSKLVIVDPYVNESLFETLKALTPTRMHVQILTAKLPSDFGLERDKFVAQHPQFRLEVRKTKEFHDRFLIADDTAIYHIGASIKDAGEKAFMFSSIEAGQLVQAVRTYIDTTWEAAQIC